MLAQLFSAVRAEIGIERIACAAGPAEVYGVVGFTVSYEFECSCPGCFFFQRFLLQP